MIKIHHDIWDKTRPFVVNLFKHTFLFCLTILVLWIMIQLPDILFPNKPLTVKALAYISETALIFHFAKDSI
ncbi:Uncharacterised protein [uncultured archaeon]|nr:Uncharacterised protein [uncultured archaeon]